YARIAKHYRRRGTSFYTVQLAGEKHELDLPPHFSSSRAAKEEADKFNAFLQKKQSVYIFAAQPDGLPFYQKMLFFASLTGFLIAVRLLRDMFAANAGELRSGHKPNRNKGKLKRNLRKDGPSEQETEAFLKEINELSNTKPPTGKKSADTVIQRRRNI
ncbi:MAG: hypothetical protein IJ752_04870, partial [Alphaproteobacteria bacterium]|nr:hypothetical protein [Alphaproteobacteria bacterium]